VRPHLTKLPNLSVEAAQARQLPPIIDAVRRSRRTVLWVSDPMHGDGIVAKSRIKTRDFTAILRGV